MTERAVPGEQVVPGGQAVPGGQGPDPVVAETPAGAGAPAGETIGADALSEATRFFEKRRDESKVPADEASRQEPPDEEPPGEEPPDEESPDEESPEESSEDEPDDDETTERRTAIEALRRNGWTDADLKAVPADRLLELGKRLAKRHADYNATFAENRRLQGELSQLQKAAAGSERQVESSAPPAGPPLREAIAKLRETLALDEDDGSKALDGLVQAIRADVLREQEPQQRRLNAQTALSRELAFRAVRDDLVGEIPDLKEAGTFVDVVKQMQKLKPDAYANENPLEQLRNMMSDAAWTVLRPKAKPDEPKTVKRPKARVSAPIVRKAENERKLTPLEEAKEFFRKKQQGR